MEDKIRFSQALSFGGAWKLGCQDVDDGLILAADLVGKVVNIGDKNGMVFDVVTVVGFDERSGDFELAGGRAGSAYSGREPEAVGTTTLNIHEIARGYIHVGRSERQAARVNDLIGLVSEYAPDGKSLSPSGMGKLCAYVAIAETAVRAEERDHVGELAGERLALLPEDQFTPASQALADVGIICARPADFTGYLASTPLDQIPAGEDVTGQRPFMVTRTWSNVWAPTPADAVEQTIGKPHDDVRASLAGPRA